MIQKVANLRKLANEAPPPNKIFEIWKSWKTQKICWYTCPPWKVLKFLQKWDALVAKDGESCEIGHFESIWASFWGKRWENLQNDQNWPFWANLSHFLAKFAIVGHFEPLQCETIWKSWKTQKNCWCTPPSPQGLNKNFQKIKCWLLDYVQLLMIGWVIQVTKVDQNVKKAP